MKPKYRVANHITDPSGNEWVVAQIWEHPKHWDYALLNVATGEHGDLSEVKETTDDNS
jgi:hypothetical protein